MDGRHAGPIKTHSRIDVPRDSVDAGAVTVAGIAWAQHTGIAKVEVRVDDDGWEEAELASVPSEDTWVQWRWEWDAEPGEHRLQVRATDKTGYTQTSERADVVPDGATGYHGRDISSHLTTTTGWRVTIRLYDTATRELRDLDPVVPGRVGIYHCGLTVQGPPHIGHIRKEVVFDVLRRWLERADYDVTIVANITDIDDKVLAKGEEQGRPWYEVAYENERALHAAYEVLGCIPPSYEPRATGHVPEMVEMIGTLVERGHAYVAEDGSGDVYFDVRSWPSYGELSNQRIDDMQAAEDAPPEGKRDPRDFALWKGHKQGEPDTAVVADAVGPRSSGLAPGVLGDGREVPRRRVRHPRRRPRPALPAPRERAGPVACRRPPRSPGCGCTTRCSTSAAPRWRSPSATRCWSARSSSACRPIALRYYLIAAHYRSIVEFSEEALARGGHRVRAHRGLRHPGHRGDRRRRRLRWHPVRRVHRGHGRRPLHPGGARRAAERHRRGQQAASRTATPTRCVATSRPCGRCSTCSVSTRWPSRGPEPAEAATDAALDTLVQALIAQREEARAAKDFATADRVRDQLAAAGIEVEDTAQGARWHVKGS